MDEATADGAVPASSQDPPNTLTDAEVAAGWALLFDGVSMEAWRTYGQEGLHDGWQAEDGMIVRVAGGGDIITRETWADFELQLEWRVEEGGNSGVFFRASEESGRIFEGAPEMQVLDDAVHVDGQNPLTSAGANYGLHPAPRGVVRPAGEWNHARIRVEGERVQHWLNGEQIVDYRLGSPEWQALVAASKFAEWPEYGTYASGHIGLQDHGDRVYFRNLKIRRLDG
ncbi:MAG: DUF1080 domain-containing protein [Gemmatimonadetes bacterium]|nr:DUF1080 domain-containing protein [Gemmatimonadota bacterium]